MSDQSELPRMDRRVAIKWMLTAAASTALLEHGMMGASAPTGSNLDPAAWEGKGYGLSPDMVKTYKPGDVWPLTLSPSQRRTVIALCDVIMPADATSPSASAVGVPDFIDEWISSPYPGQAGDRRVILAGVEWIEAESRRRFSAAFAELTAEQKTTLCDELAAPARAKPEQREAVAFFKRFRDLTAGGYYTTPEGMRDIGYVGNVALTSFEGPPPEVLRKLGLA